MSSTLIEDPRTYNNRTPTLSLPNENGQDVQHQNTLDPFSRNNHNDMQSRNQLVQPTTSALYRSEQSEDDGASVSNEKPTNPFASTNNSTAVNFTAHLQKSKSLFSNKSYLSSSTQSLSNYRMRRQPSHSSSLHRSTSSLCDDNSTSSNASGVPPSPFYNGQTAFGGASASSRRFINAIRPDTQLQSQHRSKVPSKLIPSNLSKSTSSLNSTEQGYLSTTAKRILDLMNQFNTPLADVRRVSSGLPIKTNSTPSGQKGAALLDVNTTIGASETDKLKRKLLKPNTPYNRPVGRTVTEPCISRELNVPSMSQLLQLKKLSKNTMQVRELATKSNSILNHTEDYKLPNVSSSLSNDLEVTNNNNNDITPGSKHVNKIRSNIIKSRTKLKDVNEEPPPEPVNLPNIQLAFDKNKGISFSTASLAKPATPIFNSTNTSIFKPKEQIPSAASTLKFTQNTVVSTFGTKEISKKPCAETMIPIKYPSNYSFADPIVVNSSKTSQTESFKEKEKQNFKFSEPIVVTNSNIANQTNPSSKTVADIKFESHIKSRSSITSISPTSSFGAVNKTCSPSLETTAPVETSKSDKSLAFDSSFTSTNKKIADVAAKPQVDEVFKNLVAKQNEGKWECSSCLSRNDSSSSACAACGCANTAAPAAAKKSPLISDSSSSKLVVVDDVFKKLAAQQKADSWECGSCATRNNSSQKKCLCCNEPQPSTSKQFETSSSSKASSSTPPGVLKATDDLFKAIATAQKRSSWVCTACETRNDVNKSKCACCEQARETTINNDSISTAKPSTTSTTGQFSFGIKTSTSQFMFGNVSATSAATTDQTSSGSDKVPASEAKFTFGSGTTATPAQAGQFSFGNLTPKTTTISTSTTASVTSQGSTPQFTFGSGNSNASATKAPSTQFSFGNASTASVTTTSTSTFVFGNAGKTATTSSSVSQPTFSFGNPTTVSDTSSAIASTSTTTSTGLFAFGNKAAAATTEQQKSETAVPAPVDDVFKKIVAEQKAKWECQSCMTKNDESKEKCVACETPKSSDSTSDKKETNFNTKPQFNFGSSSTQFSFGNLSKPTNSGTETSTASTNLFQFGTANKISSENKPNSTAENNTTSLPLFSSIANTSAPSFILPTVTTASASVVTAAAATTTTQSSGGFKFTFGSSASLASEKPSTDVTDGSSFTNQQKPSSGTEIKVLENILIKPATNGPEPSSPAFTFGANNNENQRIAKKRTCTETFFGEEKNQSFKLPATPSAFETPKTPATNLFNSSSTPSFGSIATTPASTPSVSFVFGQSNVNSNSLGNPTPAASTPTTIASPVVVPKSTFVFGSANSSTANVAATPPTFSFNADRTNQSSPFSTPVANATSAPVFGGNSFSMPSNPLGGNSFKTNAFGFGNSPAVPTFRSPNPAGNLNSNEVNIQFL